MAQFGLLVRGSSELMAATDGGGQEEGMLRSVGPTDGWTDTQKHFQQAGRCLHESQ